MNHSPSNKHPLQIRPTLPVLLCLCAAAMLTAACPTDQGRKPFSLDTLEQIASGAANASATEYHLDSQPFSPTLPYLFDQARLVVLPKENAPAPPPGAPADSYAFSAIDRFGRLYHFDIRARWWMAEGSTLPEALPAGQWDAAWNPRAASIELLVTAPWAGERTVQLLHWRQGRWVSAGLAKAPPARNGAMRLFHAAANGWFVAGGSQHGKPLGDGWTSDGPKWVPWAGAGQSPVAPRLDEAHCLIDGPAGSAPIVLTRSGAIWSWKGGEWKKYGSVKVEDLKLSFYVPALNQVLFVWGRGRGQDQFLWQTIGQIESGSTSMPEILAQTAMVRINDRDEGLWKGWGRARTAKDKIGQTIESLTAGFEGQGEPAVLIGGPDGDKTVRRSKIATLELPPALASVRFAAAAWVPAVGGLVAPSVCGLGIDARREPLFPPEAWESGTTSATQPLIDVLEPGHRFWIFKPKGLDWLKPPYEIHPGIDYVRSYETIDGRRRCLAWTFLEPGLLRYDFHEFHDKKVQWINSPLLTLKTIEQLALTAGDEIFLCDPVVWGDPPELVLVGWCGRLGERVDFEKSVVEGLGDKAYTRLPDRGFMARTMALDPQRWTVSTLPIPFCQGAELVVAPVRGSLYLMGGKTFKLAEHQGKKFHFALSQNDVWHWDGENWGMIQPQAGIQPRMKATSQVIHDPLTGQLLSLTPRALYGFYSGSWRCLWQTSKDRIDWPEDVALYAHPQSHLILGAWFMPRLDLRVWRGTGWSPVRLASQDARGAMRRAETNTIANTEPGGRLPNLAGNLVPSTQPDAFISLDAGRLNAMRMDAPRDRGRDRLMGACWLTLKPANTGQIAYAWREIDQARPVETALATATSAVTSGSTVTARHAVAVADAPDTVTIRLIASDDGKVVKKGHSSKLLRRLESLAQ